MIIGFVGFIGSGKDTAADYLVNFHGFRRDSFANTLKDAVSSVFGWDRVLLEGRTKEAREWREQVDLWWAQRLKINGLTPRWILQQWGTEVCRQGFHDDIWIASLENKLRKSNDNIVISDVRFPNEIKAIKNQGGKVVWVERGDRPVWYEWAHTYNTSDNNIQSKMKIVGTLEESPLKYRIHDSEWAWIGGGIDVSINNNNSIEELYSQVRQLVTDQE
jgi:hypothetical protein